MEELLRDSVVSVPEDMDSQVDFDCGATLHGYVVSALEGIDSQKDFDGGATPWSLF